MPLQVPYVAVRDQRNIGDFCLWKDHEAYVKSFDRALRDLTFDQP